MRVGASQRAMNLPTTNLSTGDESPYYKLMARRGYSKKHLQLGKNMLKPLPLIEPKTPQRRHPTWIKARMPGGSNYVELKKLMRDLELHTVCEEARCPNIGECWNSRTATFMILGDVCTRRCMFCAVKKGSPNGVVDADEPRRLGEGC